jgi:hypothetical protein
MSISTDHTGRPLTDKFSKYEFYVRDLLTVKMNESQLEEIRDHIYVDTQTDSCPFAVAYFMFRAGEHQIAIDYLSRSTNEESV